MGAHYAHQQSLVEQREQQMDAVGSPTLTEDAGPMLNAHMSAWQPQQVCI